MDKKQIIKSCIDYYNEYNKYGLPAYAKEVYKAFRDAKDTPLIACIMRKSWFVPDGNINSWTRYCWQGEYIIELYFELDLMRICRGKSVLSVRRKQKKKQWIGYKIDIEGNVHI